LFFLLFSTLLISSLLPFWQQRTNMLKFKYQLFQLLFLLLTFSVPVALSNHKAIESLLHRLDSKRALPSVQEAAAKGVLRRLLPTHLSSFEFNIVSKVVVALFLFWLNSFGLWILCCFLATHLFVLIEFLVL
jgi:hypothetical protein